MPPETVFLLGAGFSSYAGISLQKDFARDILRGDTFSDDQPSKTIVDALAEFVSKVFHRSGRKADWPDWEDLFTCGDLSANSGHHFIQPDADRKLCRHQNSYPIADVLVLAPVDIVKMQYFFVLDRCTRLCYK